MSTPLPLLIWWCGDVEDACCDNCLELPILEDLEFPVEDDADTKDRLVGDEGGSCLGSTLLDDNLGE